MVVNTLNALINLDRYRQTKLMEVYKSAIRINQVGDALEFFIKDLYCDSFQIKDVGDKEKEYSKYMSYLGNQNNPPDFIIKNSDAVEVKKIESLRSVLSLNNSYPRNKLYSDDSRITRVCKECEGSWKEKDFIYVLGIVKQRRLRLLWFIYGDCYAADREVYENTARNVKNAIESSGLQTSETTEPGRIKKVDPLGITAYRIRGMWEVSNPLQVFPYIGGVKSYIERIKNHKEEQLSVFAIMRKDKYFSFPQGSRDQLEQRARKDNGLQVNDIKVKSPDNPAKYLDAKLIEGHYNDL